MRRKICTILYRLGLHRAAYYVSPSICCALAAEKIAKCFLQGYIEGVKESTIMQAMENAYRQGEDLA